MAATRSDPKASFSAVLAVAMLVAIQAVIQAINAATLMFSGVLQDAIGTALVAALASAALLLVLGVLTGTFRGAVLAPHSAFAIGMLGPVSAIFADAPEDTSVGDLAAVAFVCLAIGSALAGLVCLLVSRAGAGNVARYLPTPVVAGIMASVALYIVIGGVKAATNFGSEPFLWSAILERSASREVLFASIVFGAAQVALMRFWRNPLAIAILPVLGIAIAGATFALNGWDMADPAMRLWFVPVVAEARWPPLVDAVENGWATGIDLLGLVLDMAVVIPALVVTAMVYVASIETAIQRDLNFNEEMHRVGLGMCAVAFAGGFGGFHSASATVLSWRRAQGDPRAAIIAAGLVAALAILGSRYLPGLPIPVTAGMLFAIGCGLLIDWIGEIRRVTSRFERLIAWGMMGLALTVGLVATLGLGLLAGSLLFVLSYRRIPVVRNAVSLADLRSNVERPEAHDRIVATSGKDVRILVLQGFLFFATAHRIYESVCQTIGIHRPRQLILDLRNVSGADASAAKALQKVVRATASEGIRLHIAQTPPAVLAAAAPALVGSGVEIHETLDRALEHVEDGLIADAIAQAFEFPPHAIATAIRGADQRSPEDDDILDRILLRCLLAAEQRCLEDGDILARVGEAADSLIFIVSGRIEAFAHIPGRKPFRVRAMLAGTVLGEIGFFGAGVRTTNLIARGSTTVLVLTRAVYDRLQKTDPDVAAEIQKHVIQKLSRRLVDRDRLVLALLT